MRLLGEDMRQCLVVDDSSVIRKVARALFEAMRFEVSEAENGRDALEQCKAVPPDVILLDWQMPVMGPLDFLAELRAWQGKKRPYVLYCTTESDANDIMRAFDAGADDYIIKPFNRDALEAKVADVPDFS